LYDEALEEADDDDELSPEPAEEEEEEEEDDEAPSPPSPQLPLSLFPRGRTAAGEARTMGRRIARREKTPVSFIVKG
jgi:hypothetical protein